jgi:hypothetical protein
MGGIMFIGKHVEVDKECCEKGRIWNDYILHLSSTFFVSRIPASTILVSFDVLVSLVHYSIERIEKNEYCRLYEEDGSPVEIDSISNAERFVFNTAHNRMDLVVDLLAQPETIELA